MGAAMKRIKKIKGLCGFYWIQTHPVQGGIISMECTFEDGYYITTDRHILSEECLKICEKCENNATKMNKEE